MTKHPKLSVWSVPKGTIAQFARALSEEGGGLSSEAVYQQILGAIWRGAFEGAMALPGFSAGVRQGADGSWVHFWPDGETKDEAVSREDIRNALCGNDPRAKKKRQLPDYENLAARRVGELDAFFRSTWLDELMLDTGAVRMWLEERASPVEVSKASASGADSSADDDVAKELKPVPVPKLKQWLVPFIQRFAREHGRLPGQIVGQRAALLAFNDAYSVPRPWFVEIFKEVLKPITTADARFARQGRRPSLSDLPSGLLTKLDRK